MANKTKHPSVPSEVVSDAEKNSKDWGLKIGKMIEGEWFERNSGGGVRYYDFTEEFHRLRRYARGEQSIRKYKDEFGSDGDKSYVNLDWKPVPIIPKFKDIMVNNLDTRLFDINVKAIDTVASKERGEAVAKLEREMLVKQHAAQLLKATGETGLNTPLDEIPDNPDELELHMQLNYKQGIEIAEEQAINYVLQRNEYEHIRKRAISDLVEIGICAVKNNYNTADGITVNYVDPAKLVWSYSEDPYFKDVYYWGEIRSVTISQLRKEFPHLSEGEVKDIVEESQGQNSDIHQNSYGNNQQNPDKIQILNFSYKTYNHSVYKKKMKNNGAEAVSKKDDTFKAPTDSRAQYNKMQITREVIYEGVKVLKNDRLLYWELQKNMVRPKADTTKVMAPYTVMCPSMYKGRIESMVQRMTPYADLIQLTHLKLQQAIQKMVPDGIFIDIDAISEVDLGGGTNYTPKAAMDMYFQTGSIVGRSMGADGDLNRNPMPIQPIAGNSGGQKVQSLIAIYNQYVNMIRDITGINEATDGSTISEYALPGTQKLAAANSTTAMRHLQQAINYTTKKVAEGVSIRISDVLEYSNTKNELIQAIGQFNVANLEDISKLFLHNFGIFIMVHPDDEEKARFQEIINIALQQGQITTADVIDLQDITNVGLASQLLKVRQKRKASQDQAAAQAAQQQQAQLQAQAAQQAAEAEAQKETVIAESKIKIEQAKHLYSMEKLQAEVSAKKDLMQTEFQYKMQISQQDGAAAQAKFDQGEEKKDERQREAASQNSSMIEQRNTKGPAQDFAALASAQTNKKAVQAGGLEGDGGFESENDGLNPVGEVNALADNNF